MKFPLLGSQAHRAKKTFASLARRFFFILAAAAQKVKALKILSGGLLGLQQKARFLIYFQ